MVWENEIYFRVIENLNLYVGSAIWENLSVLSLLHYFISKLKENYKDKPIACLFFSFFLKNVTSQTYYLALIIFLIPGRYY